MDLPAPLTKRAQAEASPWRATPRGEGLMGFA